MYTYMRESLDEYAANCYQFSLGSECSFFFFLPLFCYLIYFTMRHGKVF